MAVVKHVAPGSVFKVTICLYFLAGIVLAVCVSLASLFVPSPFIAARGVVLLAIPVAYGIVGAIGALIVTVFYNWVAGWVGGIRVELD